MNDDELLAALGIEATPIKAVTVRHAKSALLPDLKTLCASMKPTDMRHAKAVI